MKWMHLNYGSGMQIMFMTCSKQCILTSHSLFRLVNTVCEIGSNINYCFLQLLNLDFSQYFPLNYYCIDFPMTYSCSLIPLCVVMVKILPLLSSSSTNCTNASATFSGLKSMEKFFITKLWTYYME